VKKLLWVLVVMSVGFSSALFNNPPVKKVQAADYVQLKKKKKKKHNYQSLTSTTVTGDETNGDAGTFANSWLTYETFYYRKIPVPGLSLNDPFPFRVTRKADSVSGFEEEHWGGATYFISEGNVWVNYGYKMEFGGNTSTSFTTTGDYRVFSYNGGTRKKATKRKALATYNFTLAGDENNADTTAVYAFSPTTTYYYRKVAIPGLRVANLGDYRILQKTPFYQGIGEDYWTPAATNYFLTDDYLYIAYGTKLGSTFSTLYSPQSVLGDYRLYLYSDGKIKKKKLTKQYVKKYTFNVPGGEGTADKVAASSSGGPFSINYYYKKKTIPGLRVADQNNIRVLKKNSFTSGFSGESWSEGNFYITDGAIWVNYGIKFGSSPLNDTASGDYQVYLYK
jgi:hypothetical protein